jgi:DnaK suppressor protein
LYQSLQARCAALRNTLAEEVENVRRSQSDRSGDSADAAFSSGTEEISSPLAELEARELGQLERALTRLKQGTYGVCDVCQGKIPVARLNALPYTTTCIDCQRQLEGYPGLEGRRGGGDWENVYGAGPVTEGQREIDLPGIAKDLSRNR